MDLWEEKGYTYLGLKSQNLRDQASRLEKMEQEQNYTRNNSTLFESGNRLEIESDDIEEKAAEENNNQADLRNIPNNSPQQQFENANSVISDFHQPVTTESGRVSSPTGLASTIDQNKIKPNLPDYVLFPSEIKNKTWGTISHASFCNIVNGVYDEIVYYRRNISNLPSSRAGKSFIEELTFWIKQFNADSDLNSVALKAFMVLPTLILQKQSATSKSEEHSAALERRLALWKQGKLDLLLKEVRFIQGKFVNSKKARTVEDVSKVFSKLVLQRKL